MKTYFAPAPRTERRELANQITEVGKNPIIDALLTSVSGLMVVLNEDRQIVAINHSFLENIGIANASEVLGLRLGESLNCIHAHENPNGCGTTPYCPSCGAAIAIMTAINDEKCEEQLCALTSEKNGEVIDVCLLVKAKPTRIDNHRWILVFAQDITHQQFWTKLEKVFFHDVYNSLNTLLGFAQILEADLPDNQNVSMIKSAATKLYKEISFQRTLSLHKDVQYQVELTPVTFRQIRDELAPVIQKHTRIGNKLFQEEWQNLDFVITTEPLLLSRVLTNMIINAFEATKEGGMVKLFVEVNQSAAIWRVWNKSSIPETIQKRIFQRHFTTKSLPGRGLGTFSMKLFGEKYLGGKVDFSSSEAEGTTFTLTLPL